MSRDFPGGPAAKIPCSQCRGPGFNPWSGSQIPQAATEKTNKQANKQIKTSKQTDPTPGAVKTNNKY